MFCLICVNQKKHMKHSQTGHWNQNWTEEIKEIIKIKNKRNKTEEYDHIHLKH